MGIHNNTTESKNTTAGEHQALLHALHVPPTTTWKNTQLDPSIILNNIQISLENQRKRT